MSSSWLHDFGLSAESLLYVFLPALLFEAALNVDVRQLSDEVGPVLLLAVIGVIVCTFVVGLALWPISPVGILACVILGAIIATTDPVAVVAIFHDIGAPRRLSTLVQGESLFNDAAAIAIYSLAVAMLAGDRPASPLDGLVTFVREFGGGLAAGYVAGWAVTLFIPILRASRLAEATLTIAFAYVIFVVCDHYLGVSGRRRGRRRGAGGQRRRPAPAGAVELGEPRRHLGAAGLLGELADLSVCGDADPASFSKRRAGPISACLPRWSSPLSSRGR